MSPTPAELAMSQGANKEPRSQQGAKEPTRSLRVRDIVPHGEGHKPLDSHDPIRDINVLEGYMLEGSPIFQGASKEPREPEGARESAVVREAVLSQAAMSQAPMDWQ